MTEVEVYREPVAQAPAIQAPVSAHELDVMMRQADLLSQSDIIPSAYRRKPANILVAAMTGRTFGWDAITAMRNGHVIEGTWTIKPEAMLALVRRAGHSVNGTTSATKATVAGKRGDTGDEMTVEFTVNDAVRAGLCTIKDGKPYARSSSGKRLPWEQYPQAMCWARAVSQLCRMLFADVTLGLSYTPEELGAHVDADGAVIETSSQPALPPASDDPYVSADNAERMRTRILEAGCDVARVVTLGTDGRTDDPAQVHKTEIVAVRQALAMCVEALEQAERDGAESDAQQAQEAAERHEGDRGPADYPEPVEGEMEPPYPDPETGEVF